MTAHDVEELRNAGVCRHYYAANLMAATPTSSWGWLKALLHSAYDQPDAAAVHAQFDRILDALVDKLPAVDEL